MSASKNGLVLPSMRNCVASVGSALPELPELIYELAADGRNSYCRSPVPHLRVTRSLRRCAPVREVHDRTK